MAITLLISRYQDLRRVACLKDGKVLHIDLEGPSSKLPIFPFLDQIYWARVVQTSPSYAFVKLAENQVGLLPLEPSFSKLCEGEAVLVQVRREAIPDKGTRHKGPILTRNITLGGRYCLYHPFQKKRLLSSKIQDPSLRNRLQALIPAHEPVTLREAAAHAPSEHILADIADLKKKFLGMERLSSKAPCLASQDFTLASHRWMRDLDASGSNTILVDDDRVLIETQGFLKTHRPDLLGFVKKQAQSLFETYGLEDFWDSLFQDVVNLPGGGNIVMEVTATAVVIDVNPGNKDARETNKEAIPFIIQQLKGRHLGGNIIIDFIGVEDSSKDRENLLGLLKKQASEYDLPLSIFGWSKLGWVEARLPKRRMSLSCQLSLFIEGQGWEDIQNGHRFHGGP